MKQSVIDQVLSERVRQDGKWGVQNHHPDYWYVVLGEEFGEVGRAICERDWDNYRVELIHVAAVAVSMAQCFDRNGGVKVTGGDKWAKSSEKPSITWDLL